MDKINELFGINVFNDSVMKERLPEDVYKILKSTMKEGKGIDSSIADTVANNCRKRLFYNRQRSCRGEQQLAPYQSTGKRWHRH